MSTLWSTQTEHPKYVVVFQSEPIQCWYPPFLGPANLELSNFLWCALIKGEPGEIFWIANEEPPDLIANRMGCDNNVASDWHSKTIVRLESCKTFRFVFTTDGINFGKATDLYERKTDIAWLAILGSFEKAIHTLRLLSASEAQINCSQSIRVDHSGAISADQTLSGTCSCYPRSIVPPVWSLLVQFFSRNEWFLNKE